MILPSLYIVHMLTGKYVYNKHVHYMEQALDTTIYMLPTLVCHCA